MRAHTNNARTLAVAVQAFTSFLGLRVFLHPTLVVKTRIQASSAALEYTGTIAGLRQIARTEGLRGVYKGFGVASLSLIPRQVRRLRRVLPAAPADRVLGCRRRVVRAVRAAPGPRPCAAWRVCAARARVTYISIGGVSAGHPQDTSGADSNVQRRR
jgi:Mitochondrial carrier protein